MTQTESQKAVILFINWIINSWIGWLFIIYTIVRYITFIMAGRFYSVLDALVGLFFFLVGNLFLLIVIYLIVLGIRRMRNK